MCHLMMLLSDPDKITRKTNNAGKSLPTKNHHIKLFWAELFFNC